MFPKNVIGVWVGKGFIKDQNNAKLIELVLEDADVWGDSSFKNTLSLNLEAVKEEVSTEEALEMKVIDDIVTNEVYADLDCIRLYKQCIILGLG
ncbi:uncharacterized protein LOC130994690 isoform X4 [Salvia miltiorrhiza]|uniref:uncharacterized protein LOC130994690 isoform X4 n=1 Tax=Salvia miltiorrhiza TaxID=226208 RepID=UPI0025AC3C2D|nr:uncharacterized protein LOC130994690 isoform X4 [Salvia miltiorrhiza]